MTAAAEELIVALSACTDDAVEAAARLTVNVGGDEYAVLEAASGAASCPTIDELSAAERACMVAIVELEAVMRDHHASSADRKLETAAVATALVDEDEKTSRAWRRFIVEETGSVDVLAV